ncbi:sugar phosphate isomerase/epimerase family protein [Microbacterium hydrocarbonoxydans]|uniref:sugar phosphate isomerase/epimerase family protein n=1 Tax=Microbacterium hydrocarbonoxydans TaxID=273678 RepID=UPI0007BBA1DB|nr:sugar phosphate isomerase/epimerase [Microbacterium hydrocarbonoxydans]GAT75011.1 xylose isomerase domain protein TIM barrel [Microbacterium sp. HM58-2]
MQLKDLKFALNAIQWINVKEDPSDLDSASLWRFADPAFVAEYPQVLKAIRDAGFDATMMEVLDTQTLQNYAAMVEASGLKLAPGYVQVPLPSDHGGRLEKGSFERIHWFDGVRRRAEESNYFGLDSVFVAAEVDQSGSRWERPAIGHDFSQDRLDEWTEMLDEAVDVLNAEGVRPGLHNHVGTWVETTQEYEHVLNSIDASRLGASFDIGHLEWAGIDAKKAIADWSDRILDLHVKDLDLEIARRSREEGLSYERATDLGLYREPGLGGLDIVDTLSALPDGFGGWIIIEVDRASMDPVDSARHTARWLADVTA